MKAFSLRGYVWMMIGFGLLFSLAILIPDVRAVIHALVNVFATGRTDYKALIFLAYCIAILALVIVIRRPKEWRAHIQAAWEKTAVVSIVIAYLGNIGLYLWFMVSHSFPLKTFSLIYNNGQLTSMQFLHNHISKGALALLTTTLHIVPSHTADDGRTLLGLIPNIWFVLIGICILVAIASIVGVFVVRIPHLRIMKPLNRAAYVALFILSSFMIIKSLVDGGGLSFEAMIGFSFFILWMGQGSRRSRNTAVVLMSAYVVFLAVLYLCGYFLPNFSYGYASFSVMTAELLLLSMFAFYREGKTRLSVLIAVFAAIAVCGQAYNGLRIFPYLHQTIPAHDGAYVASYNPLVGQGYSLIGTAGALSLYRFVPGTDVAASSVIAATGVTTNPDPLLIPWKSCIPSGPPDEYSFTLWSATPLPVLTDTTDVYSFTATQIEGVSTTYAVSIRIPPCLAIMPTLLVDEILAQYSSTYAYYDVSSHTNDIASFAGD